MQNIRVEYHPRRRATYVLISVSLLFFMRAYAQQPEYAIDNKVSAVEIFIGENAKIFIGENAKFSSAFAISGYVSNVHRTQITDVQSTSFASANLKSAVQQVNKPVKKCGKNKYSHKETLYCPFSPFGNAALNSGATAVSAVIPSQNDNQTRNYWLTKQNNTFCFVAYSHISQYLKINTAFLAPNHNFACAAGNLPPPPNVKQCQKTFPTECYAR